MHINLHSYSCFFIDWAIIWNRYTALRLLCTAIAGRGLGLYSGFFPRVWRQAAFTRRMCEVICPGFGGLKLYIILPMLVIKVCKYFCKSGMLPLPLMYLSPAHIWVPTSVMFKSIQFVVKVITCKFFTVFHL